MGVSEQEFSEFKSFAIRLADAARGQTLKRFRAGVQVFNKAGPLYDPVTDADREAERVQVDMIRSFYPDHGVLGEEFGEVAADGPWRWVLDPVDGTRAFICGALSWTTLIALEFEGAPMLGVIDQPFTDERWIAAGGVVTYRRADDEGACHTSAVTSLAKARISTTDPRPTAYFSEREAALFDQIASKARLARFGFDAYGYALLASGELDIVMETSLQRHDWAALAPVVEGAGGVITNWRGEKLGADDRGEALAAATPALHAEVLALIAASGLH